MTVEKHRRTFISYSRVNKEFAVRLAKELRADGYSIWLDQLDIPTGARWDREVEKALKESEIFMIIMTPASVDSENVLDEIGYAIDTGKRILPVLLEECEVPFRLRRFQYVDFTNKSFDDGVESAKGLLRGLIDQPTIPRGAAVVGQQAVTEHKAKEDPEAQAESDRLAKQKADEEHLSKQKTEEETDARSKVEIERKAKEEAESDRKAEEGADLTDKQKVQEKAIHVGTVPTEPKAEPSSFAPVPKKLLSKGLLYGIGAVVVLVIMGVAYSAFSEGKNKNIPSSTIPTQATAIVVATKEKATATLTLTPTETMRPLIVPTQTKKDVSIQEKFFNLKFDQNADLSNFEFFNNGKGDEKNLDINPLENGIEFVLNDQYLNPIYFYRPYTYDDVAVRLRAENLGSDNNFNVGLVCRFTGKVWYEVSITGGGLWEIFWWYKDGGGGYFKDGGTNALKIGHWVNDYEMRCIGNKISLYINGQEVKTIETTTYTQDLSEQEKNSIAEGQVGFSISSNTSTPVDILVSEFEVYKP